MNAPNEKLTIAACPFMSRAIDAFEYGHSWRAFKMYRASLFSLSDNDEHITEALNAFFPVMKALQVSMSFGLSSAMDMDVENIARWACVIMCSVIEEAEGFKVRLESIEKMRSEKKNIKADSEFYESLEWAEAWLTRCYYNTLELERGRGLVEVKEI